MNRAIDPIFSKSIEDPADELVENVVVELDVATEVDDNDVELARVAAWRRVVGLLIIAISSDID